MNHISSLAKGIVYFCDTVNSIEAASNNIRNNDWIVRANLINQIAVVGCVISSIYLENQPDSFDSLQNERVLEFVCRFSNMFFSIGSETILKGDQFNKIRALEKIVGGFADCMRPLADSGAETFHHLSLLSNEELAKLPLSSPYDESSLPETLTQELCLEYEKDDIGMSAGLTLIRGILENGVIGRCVMPSPVAVDPARRELPPPLARAPLQEVRANFEDLRRSIERQMHEIAEKLEQDERYTTSAEALPFIPTRFHEDALFQKHICPILNSPIRDPLKDPATNHIYERLALQFWVASQGKSPQNPSHILTLDQLVEMPALKMLITRKLEYLLKQEAEYRQSESFQSNLRKETV